jgi:integrase
MPVAKVGWGAQTLVQRSRRVRGRTGCRFAVRTLLDATAEWAGLTDNGQPVRFTPHDFRRLFTTELVGAGLPLVTGAATRANRCGSGCPWVFSWGS